MSLVKNIGIGKNIFNPFKYVKENAYDWAVELYNRDIFVKNFYPYCNIMTIADNSAIVQWEVVNNKEHDMLCFDKKNQRIEATIGLLPYIEHLHSLYPGSHLAKSDYRVYLAYRSDDIPLKGEVKSSI